MNNTSMQTKNMSPQKYITSTYHSVGIIYAIHTNFRYKSNRRWYFGVFRSTFYFQAVYSVFIVSLEKKHTGLRYLILESLLCKLCKMIPPSSSSSGPK